MKIAKYVFLTIGTLLLVGAYFIYKNTADFINNATIANGTVIELLRVESDNSYTYKPKVAFETKTGEAIQFISSTSTNPPSYTEGEEVEVLYLEKTPEKARINGTASLWLGAIIVGGIGAVFFLVGFLFFFFKKRKENKIQSLKDNGIKIKTNLQSVYLNTSYIVNGRSPFVIETQWKNPATSEIHIFKSDDIWFDPTDYIENEEITVLIERNNPKKYHVDLSFLPKIAE